jgi:flagella basal body P-ring formation protein FlgA
VTLTAAAAIGMTLVRDVRAGDPIESQTLRKPPEVVRGEAVSVEVVSGQARLSFTGRAEGSGRKGDRIAVSNPSTGRRFTALIRSRGAVEIAVDRKGVE